jgi:hypothetical protein
MADRIFGPIRGAGTQVRERQPERNIVPGQLGSTVLIGVFERGVEEEITLCPSKKAFLRKMGGLLDSADFNAAAFASLEGPLAGQHFWDHSDGAGFLTCLRIVPRTSGTSDDHRPDKAYLPVFNRETNPVYLGKLIAHNGGRWAGQRKQFLGYITGTPGTDFNPVNTIQFDGIAAGDMKQDEWKGAEVVFEDANITQTFTVVSNDEAGLFTFAADIDFDDIWTTSGASDVNVTVQRTNQNYRGLEKRLTARFKNGALDPVGRFGMQIAVDGIVYLDYEELSMDDTSPYYWVDVVNQDPNNDLVTVQDDFTGNRLASTSRPANRYGESAALTSETLTIADPVVTNVQSPVGSWVPAFTFTSWGSDVLPMMVRVEVTDATPGAEELTLTLYSPDGTTFATGTGVTEHIGNRTYVYTGDLAVGIACAMDKYGISFTIGAGAGTATLADTFDIWLRPLYVNELVGGRVNPKVDAATVRTYPILSNTRTTVSISPLGDLTDGGAVSAGDEYLLEWNERAGWGFDGFVAGMTTADYEALLDPGTSPLKKLKGMNQGLVKVLIPGIAKPSEAVALQKACRNLCLDYNWQYRVELPDEYEDSQDMLDWVNNTMGRLDLSCIFVPTFGYIRDPLADSGSDAREVLVSTQAMQLGREAMVARDYDGYHKAGAGTDVTLPLITRMPVLGRPDDPQRLNEELLNPAGLNAYRWASGGGVLIAWGDRSLDNTTVFKWKHKREQLSHYENVLIENFDWAIFAINDPIADADILAAMHTYFLEEYRKRAIRGDGFVGGTNPAAIIKMDEENNTDATRAQGDQIIEVSLRLADTVERLRIIIGAMGLTEAR